jgi:hypothetical protein
LGSCQHTKEVTMSVEKPLDGDFPLQAVVYWFCQQLLVEPCKVYRVTTMVQNSCCGAGL